MKMFKENESSQSLESEINSSKRMKVRNMSRKILCSPKRMKPTAGERESYGKTMQRTRNETYKSESDTHERRHDHIQTPTIAIGENTMRCISSKNVKFALYFS